MAITSYAARVAILNGGLPNQVLVQLYRGNPGIEGLANEAKEAKQKEATLYLASLATVAAFGRRNTTQLEWVEVSTTETYEYVGIRNLAGEFLMYAKLEAKVEIKAGENFRLPINAIMLKAE